VGPVLCNTKYRRNIFGQKSRGDLAAAATGTRGFADVNNRLGLNCFACHSQAKPEFDLVCEQYHGCAPIPVAPAMFGALQRTDPRCKSQKPVSAESLGNFFNPASLP
jgi:hypothetical protein